ncbi:hypothetical protein B0H13DRAFT_2497433, partial [Mycena leptocephala]
MWKAPRELQGSADWHCTTETAGDNAEVIGGRDQAVGPLALEAPHLRQPDCEVVFLQFKINSLSQQMACIVSLEKYAENGRAMRSMYGRLATSLIKFHHNVPGSKDDIYSTCAGKRLEDHIRNGLSPLSAGSESYSDLRILQECRVTIDQAQSFEEALEAPKVDTQRYVASEHLSPRIDRHLADPADVSARSDSDHLQSPSPGINPPRARRPDFATRMEAAIPSTVFQTRRKLIQNEWNKIAREAGAAGIEFYNDVDEEECRPASGLFTFNTESEIVECSNLCGCPRECPNRVAQFPRQIHVQIFKTRKRGWGARVPVDLIKGQVVGLYTG